MPNQLKTVSIQATMLTDLYLKINIPADADVDDVAYAVRCGQLEVADMMIEDEGASGWHWYDDTVCLIPFDPKALDMTDEVTQAIDEVC